MHLDSVNYMVEHVLANFVNTVHDVPPYKTIKVLLAGIWNTCTLSIYAIPSMISKSSIETTSWPTNYVATSHHELLIGNHKG